MANKTANKLNVALSQNNQRILVTGGTGFIGVALCNMLLSQGHMVTVLTRDVNKANALFDGRVILVGDMARVANDTAFDVIINLAGETVSQRWSDAAKQRIISSRVSVTQALVDYVARTTHKPRVMISGSALGYYGVSDSLEFTENTSPTTDDFSAFPREVCAKWEATAQKVEAYGVRLCILRTGVVLEKNGGALGQMLLPFKLGLGGPMGNGQQWFSWIHRDDLIGMIVHLINHDALRGAFNGTAPNPVTNKEFARALGRALHRPAIMPLLPFQIRLLFGEMGDVLLLAGQKVLPHNAQQSGFVFSYAKVNDALQAIF
ncbi:MAG: TIGR01777 family oxidoreductase [Alphaproteobacteria bacterium]|nr:TIGR01777 family oxidoreductase [Alphaproteobacteria bacterium]